MCRDFWRVWVYRNNLEQQKAARTEAPRLLAAKPLPPRFRLAGHSYVFR